MYCKTCGMEVASTYKICPRCGANEFETTRAANGSPTQVPPANFNQVRTPQPVSATSASSVNNALNPQGQGAVPTSSSANGSKTVRMILAGVGAIFGFLLLGGPFMNGAISALTNSDFIGSASGLIGIAIGGVLGYFAIELIGLIVIILLVIAVMAIFR